MCHSPGRAGSGQGVASRAGPGRGERGRASEAGQAGRAGPAEPGRGARGTGHGAQPCGTQDGVRFSPKARMPSCPSSEAK